MYLMGTQKDTLTSIIYSHCKSECQLGKVNMETLTSYMSTNSNNGGGGIGVTVIKITVVHPP